jgi:hypothetical protein
MDNLPYSVSELAACVSAAAPRRYDLYLRRLRHWGSAGVLETTGALHVGTGRSRRFRTEQAYVAAVLLRLADLGLSIGALKAVAQVIALERAKAGDTAALWEAAKRRRDAIEHGCVFAALSIAFDDAGEKPVSVSIRLARGEEGLNTPKFYLQEDSIVVLNLTDIFAQVKQ